MRSLSRRRAATRRRSTAGSTWLGSASWMACAVTGSQVFRQANTTTQGYLAGHNVGTMASYLDNTTYLTNVRGGMLRRAGLPENFIGNPQFASARLFGNVANSTYHSMQLDLVKRFSSGWTLQSNYTWAKALGEEEGEEQEIVDSYRDNRNRRLDKRLMSFHRTHVIRNNGLWELPFGPNKKLFNGNHAVLSRFAGGWQIGAIFNIFSGVPLPVSSGVASYNNFGDNTAVSVGQVDKGLGVVQRNGSRRDLFRWLAPGYRSLQTITTLNGVQQRSTLRAITDASGNILFQNPTPGMLGTVAPRLLEGPGPPPGSQLHQNRAACY